MKHLLLRTNSLAFINDVIVLSESICIFYILWQIEGDGIV